MSIPCEAATPLTVSIVQPLGWLPSGLSFVQFCGLAALSIYTFRKTRGDKQDETAERKAEKIRERRSQWFHKVVVDQALILLPTFTQKQAIRLRGAVIAYEELRSAPEPKSDPEEPIRNAIADFQEGLSGVSGALYARLKVVEPNLARKILVIADDYEERVARWMIEVIVRQPYGKREDLGQLILDGEIAMLRLLFEHEFNSGNDVKERAVLLLET